MKHKELDQLREKRSKLYVGWDHGLTLKAALDQGVIVLRMQT